MINFFHSKVGVASLKGSLGSLVADAFDNRRDTIAVLSFQHTFVQIVLSPLSIFKPS